VVRARVQDFPREESRAEGPPIEAPQRRRAPEVGLLLLRQVQCSLLQKCASSTEDSQRSRVTEAEECRERRRRVRQVRAFLHASLPSRGAPERGHWPPPKRERQECAGRG